MPWISPPRLLTRPDDRQDLLAGAEWSDCHTVNGGQVFSPNKRWIQYRVELATSDPAISPALYEIGITYAPGSYLPPSFLTYTGPASADSQTTLNLRVVLEDESEAPIVGRQVVFLLDGFDPIPALTDSAGTAQASLYLEIAPGEYPLRVTFLSDGVYGPSLVQTVLTVTESWSDWIQDSLADFRSGSGQGIDTGTAPGSVMLVRQVFGEGDEAGEFTLPAGTWGFRHKIFIDNPNSTPLPAGYSLKLTLDTAALVTAGKLLESGDDLRLVWTGGGSPLEVDRVADTAFNTSATEIWFKTQAPIPAASRDSSYFIYYGNSSAGVPPANPVNVFALYDGFNDDTIDSGLWNTAGTVSESGGWAHLSSGAHIISKSAFTYGMLEMRIQAETQTSYMWWGWEDGPSDAPNFIVFENYPSTNLAALLRSNGNAYQTLTIDPQPAGGVTVPHIFATQWRPGQARWYIDGAQVQSADAGVPTGAMYANFNANANAFTVDWARARLLAAQDPAVNLAATYTSYVSSAAYLSAPFDTGGAAVWKYLVWDGATPAGTDLILRVRTADTQAGLDGAVWNEYPQSGWLIDNPSARWIQYQAELSTNNPSVTPILEKVTVYYLSTRTLNLQADWNLIALPLQPLGSFTAETLLQAVNSQAGNHCTDIARWHNDTWESHGLGLPVNQFAVQMGQAYFLRCDIPGSFTLQGAGLTQSLPLDLIVGLNLVSIPRAASAYTSETLLQAIAAQGGNCPEIHRYTPAGWASYKIGIPPGLFAITAGEGYFVQCSQAGTFTP